MIPPIVDRFVAGETEAGAIDRSRQLNENGIHSIINLLGEHYEDPDAAGSDVESYCQLIRDLSGTEFDACVSVKPSQIGLGVDEETFQCNLGEIVETAHESDVFVWLDMEDHQTTETTISAFERYVTEYPAMGICLQANLHRTEEDLHRLVNTPGKIRLVKGAYDEPSGIAHTDASAVNDAYIEHLRYLFEEYAGTVAVGSHDPAMIDHAIDLSTQYDTDWEIQMLMGVREDAQAQLAENHDVYQYIPYGTKWFSYFSRRALERKENLMFALRAVLGI